jgi:hypothetical protein
MKKQTFLAIALMFTAVISKAQSVPNGNFENWSNPNGYNVPDGWETLNDMTAGAGVYTTTRGGTAGNYYLKLTSENVTGMGVMPGVATSGMLDMGSFMPMSGFPYNMRPDALSGKWQFMGNSANDIGYIHVYLTKWNTSMNMRDTVGYIMQDLNGMQMSWGNFSLPFTYMMPDMPDTCIMLLSASGANPEASSYLYLDNLDFTGIIAGIANTEVTGVFSIYPNPSANNLKIDVSGLKSTALSFEIIDLHGKLILSQKADGSSVQNIGISQLPVGNYFLNTLTQKGTVTQKFIKQ